MQKENGMKKKIRTDLSMQSRKSTSETKIDSLNLEELNERVDGIVNFLKSDFPKLKEEIIHLTNNMHTEKVNEIYASLDLWITDISTKINKIDELRGYCSDLLGKRELYRSKHKTRDNYIVFLENIISMITMQLAELIPLLKSQVDSADITKRKINLLLG